MKLRNRVIKPEAASSVPRELRSFYGGLWALADDRGCLPDDPVEIREVLYPKDADIGPESVAGMIDWLVRLGKVVRYQVEHKGYLLLLEFLKYEEISRPAVASCEPLAEDMDFDDQEWRWRNIPQHYLDQAKAGYIERESMAVQTELPLDVEEKKPKKPRGPVYTEEEKLLVKHFKERLQQAGVDYFPPDWHLRQLPAARRLLEGRTVDEVMACIDFAFAEQEAGRLRMNLDHLMAIERVWPRFRIRRGGAVDEVHRGSAGTRRDGPLSRDAAHGAAHPAAKDEGDYLGGLYSGFFGRQVAQGDGGNH